MDAEKLFLWLNSVNRRGVNFSKRLPEDDIRKLAEVLIQAMDTTVSIVKEKENGSEGSCCYRSPGRIR